MKERRIEYPVKKQDTRIEIVPLKTVWGEAKAWETLSALDPKIVTRGAKAVYYDAEAYRIEAFGVEFMVSTKERAIVSDSPRATLFLDRYKDFFRLALLWYMTSAKDIPFTGRLIRPVDVKGGQRFFTGTHVLPLDRIEEKFGNDKMGFIKQGLQYGAELAKYGDAAVRLYPLPRVPVTVILWLLDDEFSARASLFFDSTIDYQISLSDIVWSLAMMSALVMLE